MYFFMNKQLLYFFVFQNLFLMLPVQQHSHNIICCCSNWTYQECHHCEDLLTLDTSPLVPYINCLLPVPPQSALTYQVSLNLPLPSHAPNFALLLLLHVYPLYRTFLLFLYWETAVTNTHTNRVPPVSKW